MLDVALLPGTAVAVGTLLALLATTVLLVYIYATRNFSYWRRKGVPYIKPLPFVGNFLDFVLFRKSFGEVVHDIHERAKEERYCGIYAFDQPALCIKDTKLWDNIVRKDFRHFTDHAFSPAHIDPLSLHGPFIKKGKDWKDLRSGLSQGFTSGKLKRFFALMEEKAKNLDHCFDDEAKKGTPKDISNACGEFTTDIVASVGFGMESDSLSGRASPFRDCLKNVFVYSHFGTVMTIATFFNSAEKLRSWFGVRFVPEKLEAFLRQAVAENVRQRKQTNTVGVRGDYLDLLIELWEKGSISGDNGTVESDRKLKIDCDIDEFIAGQAFVFLSAGFETSSTTMSFALYHLAKEQYVQDELRRRLKEMLEDNGGKITYEALQSVTYLDMVVNETLRLHPILPFLDRVCTETYRIPDNDVVIDKGVVVLCSLLGIQRDPNVYPDPERFDPERFSEDENRKRPPCTFMGFGDGPRICLGKRLGLLQAKLGLAHIILNYKLRPCPETPPKMEYGLYSFLLSPREGVTLQISRA